MKVQGRIKKLMPIQTGISRIGNNWKKQDFILEYFEEPTDQYSDTVLLSLMNERIDEYKLKVGDEVEVDVRHQVKAYGERVYNELFCRFVKKVNQAKTSEQPATKPTPDQQAAMEQLKKMGEDAASGQEGGSEDELPF